MKNILLLLGLNFVFLGCSISDRDENLKIFIPGESSQKTIFPTSALSEDISVIVSPTPDPLAFPDISLGVGENFFWKDEKLVLRREQVRNDTNQIFLSLVDAQTGEGPETWRKREEISSSGEINTLTTVKINGVTYFFDTISREKKLTIYRVLDSSKNFYVKSSGLENLQKISSLDTDTTQRIEILDNPLGIEFTTSTGKYFFDIENRKISPITSPSSPSSPLSL